MRTRLYFFTMISILGLSLLSIAGGKSYPSCKPEDYFPKKGEDFCPQLEGVTLPYCCPQPSLPALECTYYKAKTVYSAQVRKNCYGGGTALVVTSSSCVDSVQKDVVSTKLVFRGSATGSGACCAQTCPPTRVINGESLALQTATAPVSCDSLSEYSSTEQDAKTKACSNESDKAACLAYSSVCADPPPVIVAPPTPDPSSNGSPSSPGPIPPTDPGGVPSTPTPSDPSPSPTPTPTPAPVVTPPPEFRGSRDSY